MACDVSEAWGVSQFQTMVKRALLERQPIAVAFDLTRRCNLRCSHCYAGHQVSGRPDATAEVDTATAERLIREISEANCLQLVLSGGEPLLRPDFGYLYRRARELGLLVTVFTNGTLVSDELVDLMREYPPRSVEVSLYGSNEDTYRRVTNVPGVFDRAISGIHKLQEAHIRVLVKTMIVRENVNDVEAISSVANQLGLELRLDPIVIPRLDGDMGPVEQRVEPSLAVAAELADPRRRQRLRSYSDEHKDLRLGERVYHCGAGRTACHLDPQGVMRPCLVSRQPLINAAVVGFDEAWHQLVAAVDELMMSGQRECLTCSLAAVCGYCPASFALETGTPSEPVSYICEVARERARLINMRDGERWQRHE